MSTPETPAPQDPPALPTSEDAQAIYDRAAAAAERAETAAQRLEAAQTASAEETRERFPGMPEEVVQQISDATAAATVKALAARYDLQQQQPATPPAETPPPAEPPPEEPRPKPTIADRLLGNG